MAEFQLYSNGDNDPGEWFEFGKRNPFRVRIRRVPSDKAREIERRHEGKDQFEVVGGLRRRVRDLQSVLQVYEECALWAWTDLEGLTITARDLESAKLLGCQVGDAVDVTGARLTLQVKKALADKVKPLALVDRKKDDGEVEEVKLSLFDFIAQKVADMNEANGAAEEELAGN